MANDISANPWKIDTAANLYAFPVKVKNIVWVPQAVGNTLLIRDRNGKDIVNWVIPAAASLSPVASGEMGWVEGINVVTISAGEVTMAIGAGK